MSFRVRASESFFYKRIFGISPNLNNHPFQAGSILQTAFLLRHHQFCGLLENELPVSWIICSINCYYLLINATLFNLKFGENVACVDKNETPFKGLNDSYKNYRSHDIAHTFEIM